MNRLIEPKFINVRDFIRKLIEDDSANARGFSTSVDIPLSELSKRVLSYAEAAADKDKRTKVEAVHILLGVLRYAPEVPVLAPLGERGITLAYCQKLLDPQHYLDAALTTESSYLDLRGLGLKELPDAIGNLIQLENLDLSNNHLHELPDSIGQLSRLIGLDLSFNDLAYLPHAMLSLTALKKLDLRGNKRLELPAEILGIGVNDSSLNQSYEQLSDARAILEYYFQTTGNGLPLNEAKLIFVGRGGVGKSSLIERLRYRQFSANKKPTEGIAITDWNISIGNDEKALLHVWDFGGQEIMHATHQFFLTERSLYVLVLTGREGNADSDAEYWLKLIDGFEGLPSDRGVEQDPRNFFRC